MHAATVPLAVGVTWALWRAVSPLPLLHRLPALLYGLSLSALFLTSAIYHLPLGWSRRARDRLMRLDGAATVLLIIGTFLPVASYVLEGAWRRWSLVSAAVAAVAGVGVAVSRATPSPALSAALYAALGWALLLPMSRAARTLPWQGTALIVAGGILYTLGAAVFARRRPDPFPQHFGFHEVFHVLVTLAAAVHVLAISVYVLPRA